MLPEGAVLAIALAEVTPDEWEPRLAAAAFAWHEVRGVASDADSATARRAMTRLALAYHPDTGGTPDQMTRINVAYEKARQAASGIV
jgi:DnaJ-domain-containing protein 1